MLSVYRNDVIDWVVAESPEDATRVWREHRGDTSGDSPSWERLPDASVLRLNDGGGVVEKTCAEWASEVGRGFLGSTEY